MAQVTYRKFSQIVLDAHYNGFGLPEAPISERFIAERAVKWFLLTHREMFTYGGCR